MTEKEKNAFPIPIVVQADEALKKACDRIAVMILRPNGEVHALKLIKRENMHQWLITEGVNLAKSYRVCFAALAPIGEAVPNLMRQLLDTYSVMEDLDMDLNNLPPCGSA